MKYWYQNPHPTLAGFIRTMLVLEGFTQADDSLVPLSPMDACVVLQN